MGFPYNWRSHVVRFSHFVFFIFVSFLAVAGCGRDTEFLTHAVEPPPQVFSATHKLKEMEGEDKVDLLWVVDNSGSMGSYQQALIKNADTFINDFIKHGGLDWKMGVLSTDVFDNPYTGFTPTTELTFKTPNNVQIFKDAIGNLGTSGDAIEKTFAPIMKWLPQFPNFLRPQAMLAIIMVTDAEEQSGVTSADFLAFLQKTKGSLKRVISYGVFSPQDFGCAFGDTTWNYKGTVYEDVVKATNGKTYALCKDFGQNLADLGKDLFSRVSRPMIRLKTRPRMETLHLFYKGEELKAGPRNGRAESKGLWLYDFDLNAIIFHDLEFAPGENEEVQIVYEVAE